ncbi:MAG: sigma-70 family RNA polymerase sigma factor [Candidatus Paceibacterota bacterium]
MENHKSDRELVTKYLNNDEEAISVLVNRHIKAIYNFAYRLSRNKLDAEDIAQETFLKAWRNLRKFNPDQNFKSWLMVIARNTAIDFLRKKKNIPFSNFENDESDNALVENLSDPLPLPDELASKAEDASQLNETINKLPVQMRETLLLRLNENFTFEEISDILKRPMNTVKSDYRRALIRLKEMLDIGR